MSSASTVAAVAAGSVAAAAYLNAKFHLAHDLTVPSNNPKKAAVQALEYVAERHKLGKLLVYHRIEEHATSANADNLLLEFEDRSWTYRQYYDDLQRIGHWLMDDLGIQKGEMVAIDGSNSAEYLLIWHSLQAIGAAVSHINCNISGTPLVHSIKLCECRFVLADRSGTELIEPCEKDMPNVQVIYYDRERLEALPKRGPVPQERNNWHLPTDINSLIYTSGTTGLPKGVIHAASREVTTARGMAILLKLTPSDKFYTCLPLYHAAAQGLCVSPVIHAGASVRLGRKFSHKTFWPEVYESRANHLQYVGELCRYLINAPPHPLERKHRLQVAWGNGLRPDTWEAFRQRFNIPVIHELYAATDGMGASFLANRGDFSRGAIGLRGWLWHWRNGGTEIRAKIDPDTEDLVRTEDGFAVQVQDNEPGEVLFKIDPALAAVAFRGYFKNDAASSKRWLKDVFEKGDLYFRSGDTQRVDRDGRVFFVDRLGDTFRWHSENVSTNEVADVLCGFDQVAESAVYGVAVPHADGRCGCATVVPAPSVTSIDQVDFAALGKYMTDRLPRYAVPLFLRFTSALSYTGTFKIQKGQAKREGIDLDLIEKSGSKDRLFWLPPGQTAYRPYTRQDFEDLKQGRVKL